MKEIKQKIKDKEVDLEKMEVAIEKNKLLGSNAQSDEQV